MDLNFECATSQDIDILFRLSKELIDTYEDVSAIDYEKVLCWVRQKIADNISDYIRVICSGTTVGYYRLVPWEDGLELDDFYILEQHRGLGIGSRILERCCASGKPLMLYVFSGNTRAISLYRRFGFEITWQVSPTRYIMCRPGTFIQEEP